MEEKVFLPQSTDNGNNSVKRGPGRPKGSRNKYKRVDGMTSGAGREVPPTASRHDDFAHADPSTMLSRMLSMISWQQQALRNKMMGAEGRLHGAYTGQPGAKEPPTDVRAGGRITVAADTKELLDLANALCRAIEAMKKHADMAEELSRRMTAEQLLEAAIMKLEGQSLPTLNYAIKRLRAKREMLAPVLGLERIQVGHEKEDERAVDAVAALLKEPA